MIYAAYETKDKRERVKIAREALKLCPDCADAYVILAEAAGSANAACPLYQAGVEAGERALGVQAFKEDAGHFWDIIETPALYACAAGFGAMSMVAGKARRSYPALSGNAAA